MDTVYDLLRRAKKLSEKNQVNSISPEEVGKLHEDTLAYIASLEQSADSLGIKKVYISKPEMEADTAPIGTNGKALRFGQLVSVYDGTHPDSPDNGEIYAYQRPGWLMMGKVSEKTTLPITQEVGVSTTAVMSQAAVTKMVSQYDISSDNDGKKYTLQEAINVVPSHFRRGGISIKFIDSETDEYTCYYNKESVWTLDMEKWEKIENKIESEVSIYSNGLYDGFLDTNGRLIRRPDYKTSDYLLIPKNATIKYSSIYQNGIFVYNAAKEFIEKIGNKKGGEIGPVDFPMNAMYFRFSFVNTSTPKVVVKSLALDAYKTRINERISLIENNPSNEVNLLTFFPIYNSTYIKPDGTNGPNVAYLTSEFIAIPDGSEIRTYNLYNIAFYDIEFNLVSKVETPSGDILTAANMPANAKYLRFSALKIANSRLEVITYGLIGEIDSLRTELSNVQKQISTLNKQFVYDKNGRPYRLGVVDGKITAISANYKEVVILGNSLTWHEYWGGKGTNDAENWSGLNRSMSSTTDEVSWPFLLQRILQKREPTAKVTGVMMRDWEGKKDGERDVAAIPTTKTLLDAALTPATDLIIFRTGENSASGNATLYKVDVLRLIDYCLSKSPNASVLICGLFWPNMIKDAGIIAAASERGYQYISAGRLYSDHREMYGDFHIDSKTNDEVLMSHLTLAHTNDLGFYLWANNVADNLGYGAELLNELYDIDIVSTLPKGYKIKETKSPYKSLVTILTYESLPPIVAITSKSGISIAAKVHNITAKNINDITFACTFMMPNEDVSIKLNL